MVGSRYDYSIEVARSIYNSIKTDADAMKECIDQIEKYFKNRGVMPQKSERDSDYIRTITFSGGNKTIILTILGDKPANVMLYQSEVDTEQQIEEAFHEKKLFGLPVFMITIMEDMPYATISFMDRKTYLSLDPPSEQAFHHRMNILDDLVAKFGASEEDDIW